MIYITIIACAIFYRLGGMGDDGRKMFPKLPGWVFNTKARDLGIPLVCIPYMHSILIVPWWIHLISVPLVLGGLSTYHDYLYKNRDNFWLHGFVIGLGYFPYAIVTGEWIAFGVRALVLAVFMGVWCLVFGNDWVEELGRGAIIGATLPMFILL